MSPGIDTLRGFHVSVAFGTQQLRMSNESGDLGRLGPNHDFLAEDQTPSDLIFLVSGAVVAIQADRNGDDVFTDVIQSPAAIAGPEAILALPSRVGVRTVGSATLVIVPVATVRTLIHQDAELAQRFLNQALQDLHQLQMEVCRLKHRSSTQRLAYYLLEMVAGSDTTPVRFVLPPKKRFITAKIGCIQENLSRAFVALRSLGAETQRGVVVIRDIDTIDERSGI
jgi:CRP-like cAMP-binding protein